MIFAALHSATIPLKHLYGGVPEADSPKSAAVPSGVVEAARNAPPVFSFNGRHGGEAREIRADGSASMLDELAANGKSVVKQARHDGNTGHLTRTSERAEDAFSKHPLPLPTSFRLLNPEHGQGLRGAILRRDKGGVPCAGPLSEQVQASAGEAA